MRGATAGCAGAVLIVGLASWPACSRAAGGLETPTATLAQSVEARQAFQPLHNRWVLSTPRERQVLEPALQTFRARFPSDPLARVANVYLAWIALDRGNIEAAESLATYVQSTSPGTTKDLAHLILGAVLCRQGKAEAALDRLTPLVGKMIDPFAQEFLHEQIVKASAQAHRWFEALAYMDDWLRSAEPHERGAVREQVEAYLQNVPVETLEAALRAMQATPTHAGYGDDIWNAVTARLSQVAIERSDTRLARVLIANPGVVGVLGDAGQQIAHLALAGGGAPRVVGSTVGMIMPGDDTVARERATAASSGVLEILGPGSSTVVSDAGATRVPAESPALIVREDHASDSDASDAFDELAHAGAAIVLAGFDPEGASAVSRRAENMSVPTIVFSAPSRPVAGARFTFVMGEDEEALARSAIEAAQKHGEKVGRVSGGSAIGATSFASCGARPARAGEPRFPFAAWRREGIGAVVIDGPSRCASDALAELRDARFAVPVVLGIDAEGAAIPPGYAGSVTRAKAGFLGNAGASQRIASIAAWVQTHGEVPSWFAALGRDAAVLARAAVTTLPAGTVTELREIMQRRTSVQRALETATGELWTTSSAGFLVEHRMKREIVYAGAP